MLNDKNELGVTPLKAHLYQDEFTDPEDIKPTIGVNWNEIPDKKDLEIWDRLTTNFWLPEKIPVSNDIPKWKTMTDTEKTATLRVFTGLTLLDTLQGTVGTLSLMPFAQTSHEESVLTNISFMESVHAKSYSNIFMTLASTDDINEAYEWSAKNKQLQRKAQLIMDEYDIGSGEASQVASVMLESFLFYSGFYLPLRMSAEGKLTNSADVIRLIIRDEALHGYYIGYKFQEYTKDITPERRERHADKIIGLLFDLYENELIYTAEIYDDLGWTEDVGAFLKHNANKALMNLGFEGIFPQDECQFSPLVKTALDPSANENHDFFSGSGSSYVIGKAESTEDSDWDF